MRRVEGGVRKGSILGCEAVRLIAAEKKACSWSVAAEER